MTPDKAAFDAPETKPWLDKYYTVNEGWLAEDRRKLLAFARDLLNSDNAGHRLTFQLFAQSAPFANLAAVYRNFDWDGPLAFVQKSAGLSERVNALRRVSLSWQESRSKQPLPVRARSSGETKRMRALIQMPG